MTARIFHLPIVKLPSDATREQVRSRRPPFARSHTTAIRHMSLRELRVGKMIADAQLRDVDADRPKTRADCVDAERPCPFVSCTHHLAFEVDPEIGSLKERFPGLELEQMPSTCVLDVADEGGATLEVTGAFLNVTRERVRQLEVAALGTFRTGGGNTRA